MARGAWAIAAAVALVAGCSSDDDSNDAGSGADYGPLAVVAWPPNSNAARIEGALDIGDDCVVLIRSDGRPVFLVWSAEAVVWDADTGRIGLPDKDGRRQWLADGQRVAFGGSGSSFGPEAGIEQEDRAQWEARYPWVVRPDPACEFDESWTTGGLGTP